MLVPSHLLTSSLEMPASCGLTLFASQSFMYLSRTAVVRAVDVVISSTLSLVVRGTAISARRRG